MAAGQHGGIAGRLQAVLHQVGPPHVDAAADQPGNDDHGDRSYRQHIAGHVRGEGRGAPEQSPKSYERMVNHAAGITPAPAKLWIGEGYGLVREQPQTARNQLAGQAANDRQQRAECDA